MSEVNENQMANLDNQQDLGKIEISPEVIEVIASIAATEVVGVSAMHGNFAAGVVEKLGGKSFGKGVKVDLTDEGILIDVQLSVKYGVSIPDVAEQVQDNIAQTLKSMTALNVHAINVHVVGIRFGQSDRHAAGGE